MRFIILTLVLVGAGLYYYFSSHTPAPVSIEVSETILSDSEAPEEEREERGTLSLAPQTLTFADGTDFTFRIPEGFKMTVAAEGLGKARFMAESPDGRLFIPDLVDYKLSHAGKVYILEDWNEETKTFETKHTYLSNLRGPNSLAFYTDEEGRHWLYLALTAHLVRYPYAPGDTEPSGEPEIILEFPNTQAPNARSVVWHVTRTVKVHEGRIYIAIGSGCNACEQPEGDMRAMIASVLPDGTDLKVHADGLRNAVDFTWAGGDLFATENGVDHLGTDAPNEKMYAVTDGTHYGWPYCYEVNGEVIEDTTWTKERTFDCSQVPRSFAYFEPRSAPLGIDYFTDAHPALKDSFLIALHGSFDASMMRGYEIQRVTRDGIAETFMDGFQDESGTVYARPVDFLMRDANSFFFTDDHKGRLYYLYANEG